MKKIISIVVILGLVILVAAGVVGYAFLRTPEAASGPIEAIPLDPESGATAAVDTGEAASQEAAAVAQPEDESEQASAAVEEPVAAEAEMSEDSEPAAAVEEETPAEGTAAGEAAAETAIADATAEAEAPAETAPEAGADAAAGTDTGADTEGEAASPTIYEIVPAESEARFYIDEVLQGDPITVVGVTNQVAGQLAMAISEPSTAQLGVVQVNARTLATDNEYRNRAIKNRILLTDNHEFVTFSPTEITGLPDTAQVGETYIFQISGDLTIIGNTRPVTFEATVTPVSETRLEGTASTAFLYTDFDMFIPDARVVDTVDDEVRLELEFVAEEV